MPVTGPALTLDEAKKLMASLELKNFKPSFSRPNSGTWGPPGRCYLCPVPGRSIDDHILVIETVLLYNNDGFVGE
jgi:hypothetical protein